MWWQKEDWRHNNLSQSGRSNKSVFLIVFNLKCFWSQGRDVQIGRIERACDNKRQQPQQGSMPHFKLNLFRCKVKEDKKKKEKMPAKIKCKWGDIDLGISKHLSCTDFSSKPNYDDEKIQFTYRKSSQTTNPIKKKGVWGNWLNKIQTSKRLNRR